MFCFYKFLSIFSRLKWNLCLSFKVIVASSIMLFKVTSDVIRVRLSNQVFHQI